LKLFACIPVCTLPCVLYENFIAALRACNHCVQVNKISESKSTGAAYR